MKNIFVDNKIILNSERFPKFSALLNFLKKPPVIWSNDIHIYAIYDLSDIYMFPSDDLSNLSVDNDTIIMYKS